MKLIFDQNLSFKLVARLATEFPDSIHVKDVDLEDSGDSEIWTFAGRNNLTIVSKDVDFQQRAILNGHPPKVIWIRLGNCTTKAIEELIRLRQPEILKFDADPEASFLVLS